MTTTAVMLNSGGMDSYLLAHWLRHEGITPVHVFVDVGQAYRHKERCAAQFVADSVGAALHSMRGAILSEFEHSTGIIPFRNAELLLNAAQWGDDIYMGVLAHEINSDKSPQFLDAVVDVLNISHRKQYWTEGREFAIYTPLRSMTKTLAVAQYLQRGGNAEQLLRTVSCYSDTTEHCGKCASCFKRWVALVNNGINTVGHFLHDPVRWRTKEQWETAFATYPQERTDEIVHALATHWGE